MAAEIVVLGYGYQYQGGYLFSIDDTTPATGSIGGKVVISQDLASQIIVYWSPEYVFDSTWEIDETSITTMPSPSASSNAPAILYSGQLNCNGNINGVCNSHNLIQFYGTAATCTAGICTQPLNTTGVVCAGG